MNDMQYILLIALLGLNFAMLFGLSITLGKVKGFTDNVSIYGIKVSQREDFGRRAMDYMDDFERRMVRLEHSQKVQSSPRPRCVDRPEDV